MSYITRTGVVLLNPSEKANKFLLELSDKKVRTNDLKLKKDKNGKQIKLTERQIGYRAGYLAHQKDSNAAFKATHKNYKRKTSNKK